MLTGKKKKRINLQVHSTSKHASTETPNGSGGNFRKVDRADDASLSNTKPSNKATSIDCSHVPVVSNEDGNSKNPENAELTSSPNTTDTITNDESTVIQP